jgi:SPP1 gp7 family putative phage head morphogenesis protein
MSPVYESEVVRAARGFKAAILSDDATQMAHLADRYLQIELGLEDVIAALSERIANMEDEGRATYWQVQKLSTYQRLQLRLAYELNQYNAWVAANVREEQLRFAGLGTDHAASLLNVQKSGTAVPLTSAERDRLMAMIGYAGDGSPLSTLLSKSGDIVRNAVTRELLQAVSRSQNPRLTARAIRKATGMALNRAMAIARTEQLRVYREATAASYRASGIQWYQRIAARDPATCLACLSLDGEISTSDASVDDHVAGRCVVGETLVSGPRPLASMSRPYAGEMVTLRTASGQAVTCTPHHPVLTQRGWINAESVAVGDYVLASDRHSHIGVAIEAVRNEPKRTSASPYFGCTWDALSARSLDNAARQAQAERCGQCGIRQVSREDRRFHTLPRLVRKSALCQQGLQADCAYGRCVAGHTRASLGGDWHGTERNYHGDHRDCSRSALLGAGAVRPCVFDTNVSVVREPPLGATASSGPSDQMLTYVSSIPGHALVWTQVVSTKCRQFDGTVYNMSTAPEWYFADGIVVHNCTSIPIVPGVENPQMEPAQSWFDRQAESTQRAMMGDARYSMYQSGRVGWSDLGHRVQNPTWGPSPQVVPVKDLAVARTAAA